MEWALKGKTSHECEFSCGDEINDVFSHLAFNHKQE